MHKVISERGKSNQKIQKNIHDKHENDDFMVSFAFPLVDEITEKQLPIFDNLSNTATNQTEDTTWCSNRNKLWKEDCAYNCASDWRNNKKNHSYQDPMILFHRPTNIEDGKAIQEEMDYSSIYEWRMKSWVLGMSALQTWNWRK